MPARGHAPGYKGGRYRPELGKRLPYWMARQIVRDPMGFPDPCIPLPPDAADDEIALLCRQHTERLYAWMDRRIEEAAEEGLPPNLVYDGTVASACEIYQRHPHSRFHKVKSNTRKSYTDSLKVIIPTVGKRLIRNLSVFDCEHWYEEWKKPAYEGGPERIDRAHDAIAMFKMVIRFVGIALRRPECKQLSGELEDWRFEKGGAREVELSYHHAVAFRDKALELGRAGVEDYFDALYMAIGVVAQFDLGLRPKDVIGQWLRTQADAEREAQKARIDPEQLAGEWWLGWFTWELVPGWRWRMRTSKSKYKSAMDFDLTRYTLLFPLLETVPHHLRTGAIVKGEHGLPIRARTYQRRFRRIARAAGIPDEVWSMDARAGAATEGLEALEATTPDAIKTVQPALSHTRPQTTERYIRRRAAANMADARANRRRAEGGEAQ